MTEETKLSEKEWQERIGKVLIKFLKEMTHEDREVLILIQNVVTDVRIDRIETQLKEIQETIGKFKH
jgi:hypothetical protein